MMPESTRRRFLLQAGALPLAAAVPLAAQDSNDLLRRPWSARWISAPGSHPTEYGVYHFRRTLDLPAKPLRFLVHVSADNRYQFFVNGRRAAWGPARGDLFHWRYETMDLAPYLEAGKNVLAALVWNFGDLAPEAQITFEAGFVLQGDTGAERAADTGPAWKCLRERRVLPAGLHQRTDARIFRGRPRRPRQCRGASVGLGSPRVRRLAVARRRGDQPRRGTRSAATPTPAGCWCRAPSPPWKRSRSGCNRCAAPREFRSPAAFPRSPSPCTFPRGPTPSCCSTRLT